MNEIPIHVTMKGFWKIEAVKPDGEVYLLADWFPNLVTNSGRAAMKVQPFWMTHAQVGTDNQLPSVLDTNLPGWVAGTNTTFGAGASGANGSIPWYGWKQRVWDFAPTGSNVILNEVAAGWGDGAGGSGNIVSRGLIVDITGTQVSVNWVAGETLRMTYEMRYYPPLNPVLGSIVLDGISYDYTLEALAVTGTFWYAHIGELIGQYSLSVSDWSVWNGGGVAIEAVPTGLTAACDNATQTNVDDGIPYTMGMTVNCGATGWNIAGGFNLLRIRTTAGDYQLAFDTLVPKTTNETMFFKFNISWVSELYNSDWQMQAAGAADPVFAMWNTSVALDRLKINDTDQYAIDFQDKFDVPIGSYFTITDTVTGDFVIYQSNGANIDQIDYYEYQVTQIAIQGTGPVVGNICNISVTLSL